MNCIFSEEKISKMYTHLFLEDYMVPLLLIAAISVTLLLAVDSILALKDYCDGQGNLHTVQTHKARKHEFMCTHVYTPAHK